jgi:hypothetical protein
MKRGEEILREKDILVAITIEVTDGNAKGGSELRFPRERLRFEAISAI